MPNQWALKYTYKWNIKKKPKIAEYHFTTLSPNLGVVKTIDNRVFVAADLPGLIKGASLGEGLGDRIFASCFKNKSNCAYYRYECIWR